MINQLHYSRVTAESGAAAASRPSPPLPFPHTHTQTWLAPFLVRTGNRTHSGDEIGPREQTSHGGRRTTLYNLVAVMYQ